MTPEDVRQGTHAGETPVSAGRAVPGVPRRRRRGAAGYSGAAAAGMRRRGSTRAVFTACSVVCMISIG